MGLREFGEVPMYQVDYAILHGEMPDLTRMTSLMQNSMDLDQKIDKHYCGRQQ